MQNSFVELTKQLSNLAWGYPLLILLIGGGLYFLISTKFAPFRYLGHAIQIVRGKYDNEKEDGQLKHYQALSTAIAGTVGMGNIAGVAVAITVGGPGAIFWMWVSAIVGVATKFFTCTLAVMYRGRDSSGEIQGGPMYWMVEGLGKKWKPAAIFFSVAAMVGVLPLFQANQLTQVVYDIYLGPVGFASETVTKLIIGIVIAVIVGLVIIGGIKRIGEVTGKIVPIMVVIYVIAVLYIIFSNAHEIIPSFKLIFHDAFTGDNYNGEPVFGGVLGALIITGIRRAAFSNEAGMGSAPMAHGAAKTDEPVREGLVAMLGPIIDTLIVCTMTALALIITGVWKSSDAEGVSLTAQAFGQSIPFGKHILMICVLFFSMSTLFAFPYYGSKCTNFLFGAHRAHYYNYIVLVLTVVGSVAAMGTIVNIIDTAYALMAFPTMISALLLSKKVRVAAKDYFRRYNAGEFKLNK
ncbi:MAG: alanine/glycine:cation symporter family protein [Mangrovibacterium sp.]